MVELVLQNIMSNEHQVLLSHEILALGVIDGMEVWSMILVLVA